MAISETTSRLSSTARATSSSAIRDLLSQARRPDVVSMAGGLPAPDALPVERVAAAVDRVLTTAGRAALQYGLTEGEPRFREWAARREGVSVERIVTTSGAQQGLDLVCRALLEPGDAVVVSEPDYLGALQCFRSHRARLVGVATDGEGIDVAAIEQLAASGQQPKVCYVVPTFHNPTGSVLSTERRVALADVAARHGIVVIEDEPYRDLWFRHQPPPVIGPGSDHVVRLRSTSKILAPGLRVGWIDAPGWLTPALARLKQCTDLQTSTFTQLVAVDVLDEPGWLDEHLVTLRSHYRTRSDALLAALRAEFGDRIEARAVLGGMFAWARLPGVDTSTLLAEALDRGVTFVPGAVFGVERPDAEALRLSFSTLAPDELRTGVRRLAAAVSALST
ncbi:MAG: PLP-dependent aminotransferase family protein [Acidimicrobiales bacterium]|nr:PLP-dependent aminotransferase family protein [Acidimicrobiales bacterium]